jgi:ATP-dependent DNA ligase
MDGSRALACVEKNETCLVSRKGNVLKSFPGLAAAIHTGVHRKAVLDGEIVCLDENGHPKFYDLLRRSNHPATTRSISCGSMVVT